MVFLRNEVAAAAGGGEKKGTHIYGKGVKYYAPSPYLGDRPTVTMLIRSSAPVAYTYT